MLLTSLWAEWPRDVAAGIVLSASTDLRQEGADWFGTVGVLQEDLHHAPSERARVTANLWHLSTSRKKTVVELCSTTSACSLKAIASRPA